MRRWARRFELFKGDVAVAIGINFLEVFSGLLWMFLSLWPLFELLKSDVAIMIDVEFGEDLFGFRTSVWTVGSVRPSVRSGGFFCGE